MRLVVRLLKWTLIALVSVLLFGWYRFKQRAEEVYPVKLEPIVADPSPRAVERGQHLAQSIAGCGECHGADLGGRLIKESPLFVISAPNLTSGDGGAVAGYTDADWVRAILHGVGRSGRPLLFMPSASLRGFSDEDVAAMMGYLRSVPPVDRRVPPAQAKLPGQILAGIASLPLLSAETIDHRGVRTAAPPIGPTRVYGIYLAQFCSGCHGKDLRGGIKHDPDQPASADISPAAMAGWSYDAFVRMLREGKRRDGTDVSPAMPWQATRNLSDDEIQALWLALRGARLSMLESSRAGAGSDRP